MRPPRPPRRFATPSLAEDATEDQIGSAVMLCQGYLPECFSKCECQSGDCFRPSSIGYKRVHSILTRLRKKAGPAEAAWFTTALAAIERERSRE